MRGYTFDRYLALERAKASSKVFRESQYQDEPKPKPAVMLRRAHDGAHDDNDDSVYVSKEPKVPTYVIWIAAGCVALAVIAWSAFSAAKTRRRLEYLEKLVTMLAQKQGIFVTAGF